MFIRFIRFQSMMNDESKYSIFGNKLSVKQQQTDCPYVYSQVSLSRLKCPPIKSRGI